MARDSYLDHIAAIPLFSQCSKKDLRAIEKALTDTDVKPGTVLMREGEDASSFVILVAGQATVSRDGEVVATLESGTMIGEMAILMDRPRSATVVAATECEILVGERRVFEGLLDEVPGLARKVLHALAERVADNETHALH